MDNVKFTVTKDQAKIIHRSLKGALHARIRDLQKSMPEGRRDSIRREIDRIQGAMNIIAPGADVDVGR